ncbi:MAG: hypothetical protein KF754_06525 [Planctomycetes bacterium]|nr:hypothetical protein [Planctomycetota bacterium]
MFARQILPALLLTFCATAALLGLQDPRPALAEAPVWQDDFKAALQTAREQDKPIFLVFRCVP